MCNGYCWQLKNVPFKYVSWHWNISPSHKIRSGTAQYHIKDQLFGFLSALQRIFTGHSLNNKINKCESWCYVCSAQALHDAISTVHICMICLKSPCPQPQLWPIRARLNIYIWLVMYNCTISRWGYALVAREYFKERGEQYGTVWGNVAPFPFGSLIAKLDWCCLCYLSVYIHNN